jgi:hypothetical protein
MPPPPMQRLVCRIDWRPKAVDKGLVALAREGTYPYLAGSYYLLTPLASSTRPASEDTLLKP